MDAATLVRAEPNLTLARAQQLLPGCIEALHLAGCTTVNRAAMFLAQIGAESGSLRWTEELADGTEYNGRADLGNTQPGDGPRFKGRSFIQITGRSNYGAFSQWAHDKGLVPTPTYFVDHPEQLAGDRWAWIGAVWYWIQPHARYTTQWRYLNDAADHDDVVGATYIINGGQNGIDGRRQRYQLCKGLGAAILPGPLPEEEELNAADRKFITDVVDGRITRWVSWLVTGHENALASHARPGLGMLTGAPTNAALRAEIDATGKTITDAVAALTAQVQALRGEVAQLKAQQSQSAPAATQ